MKEQTQQFAFPNNEGASDSYGMTLRDYFAAKAMQAIISNSDTLRECINYAIKDNIESNDEVAFKAYAMADAMLKQREL